MKPNGLLPAPIRAELTSPTISATVGAAAEVPEASATACKLWTIH